MNNDLEVVLFRLDAITKTQELQGQTLTKLALTVEHRLTKLETRAAAFGAAAGALGGWLIHLATR